MNESQKQNLPMNWYKWFNYAVLPFSTFVNFLELADIILKRELTALSFIIAIALIGYEIFLMAMMAGYKKDTFTYIIIYLGIMTYSNIINVISTDFLVSIISAGIIIGIYFVPQYIYFQKRKNIFIN